MAAAGGTGSTTVTTLAGCAWTGVSNNTSWLTVTSGASGNGPGTVAFSAAANPNATQRSGSLTIAGQTFSVTQAAASCTYAINPASQSVAAAGGTGSTTVTAPTGCAWTGVSNNTSWLTVTSGASGNGPGTVAFSAAANPNGTQRSGSLTIAGQTFSVTQAAASCTYTINPASQSVAAAGGTGSTAVTAPTGCAWTGVSNNTSWLTVTSGASGSGGGSGRIQRRRQRQHDAAQRHAHDRRADIDGHPGGRRLHVCDQPDEPVGGGRWRDGLDDGHDIGRLRVDGCQQQHVVADGHEWGQRQRPGHGRVQRGSESECDTAHRLAHHRRPDVLGDAGRDVLHVRAAAREPVGGGPWRHGVDDGHDIGRLCVDRREQRHVVADDHERC